MPRIITLKDVADEAGVHISTASRALNADTRSIVNEETAVRVLAIAERLNYRLHPLAQGLRTNRTSTIGMIVPDLTNPLFPPIHAGAESSLREMGYSLLIGSDNDDPVQSENTMAALLARRIDGLILATAHRGFTMPSPQYQDTVPAVLVVRTSESASLPSIVGDDHAGIGLVVRHLVAQGHTEIAHIAGPPDLSTGHTRRNAFESWMRAEGLESRPELILEADSFRTNEGRSACDTLLDAGASFTAIVAGNDLIALGCYDALANRGLNVPGDVSVTGYNDVTFIDRVSPPLTTVAVPFREMGAAAARMLLSFLAVDDGSAANHETLTMLSPSLVVRGSTRPIQ